MLKRLSVVVMAMVLAALGACGGGESGPDPEAWVGTYSLAWTCDAEPCTNGAGFPPAITNDTELVVDLYDNAAPEQSHPDWLIFYFMGGGAGFTATPNGD